MADRATSSAKQSASGESSPAVIIAGLLYLIAAYQRTPCPCVALCIVRHLECLDQHDAVDPVIRQICRSVRQTWAVLAAAPQAGPSPQFH